jgi:hypothetical protein
VAQAYIPLAAGGLRGSAECVRGPFWEAHLVIGEKQFSATSGRPQGV